MVQNFELWRNSSITWTQPTEKGKFIANLTYYYDTGHYRVLSVPIPIRITRCQNGDWSKRKKSKPILCRQCIRILILLAEEKSWNFPFSQLSTPVKRKNFEKSTVLTWNSSTPPNSIAFSSLFSCLLIRYNRPTSYLFSFHTNHQFLSGSKGGKPIV